MGAPINTEYLDRLLTRLPRIADAVPACPFAAQLDAGRALTPAQVAELEAAPTARLSHVNAPMAVSAALRTASRARASARRGDGNRLAWELKYVAQHVNNACAQAKRAMEAV